MQSLLKTTSLLACLTTCLSLVTLAHADLTVETKITGGRTANESGTIKQYYKGSKVRTETGSHVTIYDTATERAMILDDVKKTYYFSSTKRMEEMMKDTAWGGMMSKMKMTVTGDVKPGGQTKIILGKSAQNYKYNFVMNMDISGLMAMVPEKERKNLPKGGMNGIKTTITGELWTTTAVSLPNPSAFNKTFESSGMQGMMGGADEMAEKMKKVQGFTLLATQQIGLPKEALKSNATNKPKEGATKIATKITKNPVIPPNMTMRQEAISLKEGALDDSLFMPPKGYKQIPMPAFNLQDMQKEAGK